MALITCPECGKSVSESAKICPECGYKLQKSPISKKLLVKTALLVAIIAVVSTVGIHMYKTYQAKQAAEEQRLLEMQIQEETVKAIEALIENLSTSDEPSDMLVNEVYELYNSLDDEFKTKVSNFDKMEEIKRESILTQYNQMVKNLNFTEADKLLDEIRDSLNSDEKLELLKTYGKWYCFAYAENNLIKRMKNPSSYSRNSGSCSYLFLIEPDSDIYIYDNEYGVTIEIEYMGTNSFGGYVSQKYKESHYFVIDIETMSIKNVMSGSERVAKMVDLRMAEREKSSS